MRVSDAPIQLNESDLQRLSSVLAEDVGRADSQIATHLTQVQDGRKYLDLNKYVKPDFKGASVYQSSFVKQSINAQVSQTLPQLVNQRPILRMKGNDPRSETMTDEFERFYQELYIRYLNLPAMIRRAGYSG